MNSFLHGTKHTTGHVVGGLLLGYLGISRRQPAKMDSEDISLLNTSFSMGIFRPFKSFFKTGNVKKCLDNSCLSKISITNKTFLYHMRSIGETEEKFDNTKWFVTEPKSLLVVFAFRIWQAFSNPEEVTVDILDFHQQNLIVDYYYIRKPVTLVKFECYSELEQFTQCLQPESGIYNSSNNFEIAQWFQDNLNITGLDGWFKEVRDNPNSKVIKEIMIIPSSSHKLDLVDSEPVENVLDLGKLEDLLEHIKNFININK